MIGLTPNENWLVVNREVLFVACQGVCDLARRLSTSPVETPAVCYFSGRDAQCVRLEGRERSGAESPH